MTPFQQDAYDLPGVQLRILTPGQTPALGAVLAVLDPWWGLGYLAPDLTAYLSRPDPALRRFGVWVDDALAGVLCVRHPWLRGAYLELLGIWPAAQGRGLGSAMLAWLAAQAGSRDPNLWATVSATNTRAQRFYARHGLLPVAELPDLVRPGCTELLLRKRL